MYGVNFFVSFSLLYIKGSNKLTIFTLQEHPIIKKKIEAKDVPETTTTHSLNIYTLAACCQFAIQISILFGLRECKGFTFRILLLRKGVMLTPGLNQF